MKILLDLLPGQRGPLGDGVPLDRDRWVQVRTPAEIERAARRSAPGVWLCGQEQGGPVGAFSTLVLIRAVTETGLPWVVSGLGMRGMAAALAVGASGVVLDVQTWLTEGSPLSEARRKRLIGATARDTAVLPPPEGAPYDGVRVLTRGLRDRVLRELPADWVTEEGAPIPAPSSVGDLARVAGCRTVADVVAQTRTELLARLEEARAHHPLRGDPLGAGTPVVQGPMANVSERYGLALAISAAGGTPFAALGALRPDPAREVLQGFASALEGRPWGVGVIGFDVMPHRDAHLDAIAALPPSGRPAAITLAGGSPQLAASLASRGLTAWLHTPSARLTGQALDAGVGVILEGHEAGGHVGALTSAALWEEGLEQVEARPGSLVILAGGLGDAVSAAFAGAMAARAHRLGARVALQAGTAFFFTHEIVEAGQLTVACQEAALAARETVLVGATARLPLRCAPNPYTEATQALERRWLQEGLPLAERRARLEHHNLGRARIAAKGIERDPAWTSQREGPRYRPVPPLRQRVEGAFTMGQGAAVTHALCTVEELVRALSTDAARLLETGPVRPSVAHVVGGPPSIPRSRRARASAPHDPVPIAVVGMGCVLPGAPDVPTFWRNLLHGVDAVRPIPDARWSAARYQHPSDPSRSYTRLAGVVDLSFDPAAFRIPPRVAPTLDRSQKLALVAAEQAVRAAGWQGRIDPRRAAVVLGNAMGGEHAKSLAVRVRFREVLDVLRRDEALAHLEPAAWTALEARVEAGLAERLPPIEAESMAGLLSNVIAGRVAAWLDWMGGNLTVDAACAASLAAVAVAVDWLRSGRVDAVLTGGVDTDLAPESFVGFCRTQALSQRGSAPFSAEADGFVMGEGCAVFALERLDDALAAGRPVWAVIRGVGQASDGRGRGITAPRAEGQRLAIARAHEEAGFGPEAVDFVEAHGTGTPLGDATEAQVLAAHLEGRPRWLGSVKSGIGHLKAAAGAAGLLKAVLAVRTGVLPPTLHAGPVRSELRAAALRLPRGPVRLPEGARGAVSAFGFGGTDFHVLIEAPEADPPPEARALGAWAAPLVDERVWADAPAPRVLCFAADSLDGVRKQLAHDATCSPEQAAEQPVRLVLIDGDGVVERARRWLSGLALGDVPVRALGTEAWLGVGDPEPVVVLVPGQGAQQAGTFASLARIPAAARVVHQLGGREALARIEASPTPEDLHQSLFIAAVAWGAALREAGVPLAATAGHSLGELGALVIAGRLSPEDGLALARIRGGALEGCPEGGLLAVDLPPEEAEGFAAQHGLTVAAVNGSRALTLAGPVESVRTAHQAVEGRARARILDVRRAFHSPSVAPAAARLRGALSAFQLADGLPCWSATTVAPFRDLAPLADGITATVRFADVVGALRDQGRRLFVEVGPGSVLSGLVAELPDVFAVPLDPRPSDELGLVRAAAALLAAGHPGLLRALPATVAWAPPPAARQPAPQPVPSAPPAAEALRARAEAVQDLRIAALADPAVTSAYQRARADLLRDLALADAQRAGHPVLHASSLDVAAISEPPAPKAAPPTAVTAPEVAPPAKKDRPTAPGFAKIANAREVVIATIAEVTGYPPDLLEGDASLEADLGVDSIRKMEILGLLEQRCGFQARDADYATLADADVAQLVAFVEARRAPAPAPPPPRAPRLHVLVAVPVPSSAVRTAVPAPLPPAGFTDDGHTLCWHTPPDPALDPCVDAWLDRARGEPRARLQVVVPPDPIGGALAGFARSLAREWDAACQIVVARPDDPRLAWALTTDHPELTLEGTGITAPAWIPLDPVEQPLPERPVLLATGGTRGILVPCLRALADLSPRVLLLGRSAPDPRALSALQSAGVEVHWRRCDVTLTAEVVEAASEARSRWGRIDVVLHGAGTLRDGPAATRTRADLDAVLAPKLQGAENLVAATLDDHPTLFASLSSVVARLGNPGQTLYGAANGALEAVVHPTAGRTLVLASTAWEQVGMAADPALQRLLRARGVHPVAPEAGARAVRQALLGHASAGPPVQVRLLAQDAPDLLRPGWPLGPLRRLDAQTLVAAIPLDPSAPELADHQVGRRPLVPAALWLRALEQAARLRAPGQAVCVEDFAVLHPTFVSEPRRDVQVVLTGAEATVLAGQVLVARGRVQPAPRLDPGPQPAPLDPADPASPLYRPDLLFHGPAWRVLRRFHTHGDGLAAADLEPDGLDPTASAIDGAHQLLALWAGRNTGHLALPVGARRWILGDPAQGPLRVETRALAREGNVQADVIVTTPDGRVVLRGEAVQLRRAGPWTGGA